MEELTMYRIGFTDSARRFVEGADAPLQRRLHRCFELLKTEPRRHPNIVLLRGEFAGHYRFRVGDYRVVYCIHERQQLVEITEIGHRREVYRR